MEAVMTGAPWTRHRISSLSSCTLDTTACQRCDCGQETDLHRNWQCPCNVHFSSISQNLTRRAQGGAENLPCFWLRGILPATWTSVEGPTDSPLDESNGHANDLRV
eukprot:1948492-Pyramimonas_sp.AAC.1